MRGSGRLAQVGHLGLALMLGVWLPAPTAAHDVEDTHVRVTFSASDRYQIDILNHADWLWLRLVGADETLPLPDERDRQLRALTRAFSERVTVRFDGSATAVESVEYIPPLTTALADDAGWTDPGVMRVVGTVPAGARTFQFAYALVDYPYPMTVNPPTGEPVTRWLRPLEVSAPWSIDRLTPMTRAHVAVQYLQLGFTHIVPRGLDHILFVLGLFLLSPTLKPILWQITAFTIAHTITLGLTIYGVVSLSPDIVEPLIALSIVYVAVENLVTSELTPWRVALVFGFGLLHGMGFAGVLADLGLPRSEFLTALVTFNVGVETGQLAVVAGAFAVASGALRREWYQRRVAQPACLGIALIGVWWTLERLLG